jgi:hypothetical protein
MMLAYSVMNNREEWREIYGNRDKIPFHAMLPNFKKS